MTADVQPGGYAQVGSPSLPKGATKAAVDVAPADGERKDIFQRLHIMFAGTKSKKTRLLTCLYLYAITSNIVTDEDQTTSFKDTDPNLAFLFLATCAQMALQIPSQASASGTASPCEQAKRAVAIKVSKVGSRYRVEVNAPSRRTKRPVPLKIACRPKGAGVRLTVRPRSRKKTLRKVVGRSLSLGFVNPADADQSAAVKTTFLQPR